MKSHCKIFSVERENPFRGFPPENPFCGFPPENPFCGFPPTSDEHCSFDFENRITISFDSEEKSRVDPAFVPGFSSLAVEVADVICFI